MTFSLRRRIHFFAALTLAIGLAGCGQELSCSAPETQQLVKQIALDEAKKAGLLTPGQPSISYLLGSIVTTEKGTTKTACKAVLADSTSPSMGYNSHPNWVHEAGVLSMPWAATLSATAPTSA